MMTRFGGGGHFGGGGGFGGGGHHFSLHRGSRGGGLFSRLRARRRSGTRRGFFRRIAHAVLLGALFSFLFHSAGGILVLILIIVAVVLILRAITRRRRAAY